jgi:gluconokinase
VADSERIVAVVGGVSGTGKSTVATALATRLGWPMLEGDELHPRANIEKMSRGEALTDEDRWPWLFAIADWIGEREAEGENGVVTCSALKRSYRNLLCGGHPSVRFIALVGGQQALAERMRHRPGHFMPVSLLASQLATFEPLGADEPGGSVSVEQSPDAVVRDVLRVLGVRQDG